MEKRYIGIDLHRNRFSCCVRLASGRTHFSEWALKQLPRFVKKLRPTDEVAVEVTGNTRLFYDAVAPRVARAVVVDTNQFRVISRSVKKTDERDAALLVLYLSKELLPEVRMKDKQHGQLASLTQTRDTLVKLRTSLKNKVNNRRPACENGKANPTYDGTADIIWCLRRSIGRSRSSGIFGGTLGKSSANCASSTA